MPSPLRDPVIDPNKDMAGRTVQGLIDVLEGTHGGDITKMPFVVRKNKDATEVAPLLMSASVVYQPLVCSISDSGIAPTANPFIALGTCSLTSVRIFGSL